MLSRLFVFTLTRDPSACACVCAMLTFHLAILLPFFFGRPPNFALLRNETKKRAPDSSSVLCLRYTEGKHTQYQFFVSSRQPAIMPSLYLYGSREKEGFLFPLSVFSKKKIAWSPVKRAAKTCNLFCNIAAKRVEKRCCAFYRQHSNRSCDKSGCCRLRKQLQKVESSSTFCNKLCTLCSLYRCKDKLVWQRVTELPCMA